VFPAQGEWTVSDHLSDRAVGEPPECHTWTEQRTVRRTQRQGDGDGVKKLLHTDLRRATVDVIYRNSSQDPREQILIRAIPTRANTNKSNHRHEQTPTRFTFRMFSHSSTSLRFITFLHFRILPWRHPVSPLLWSSNISIACDYNAVTIASASSVLLPRIV